MTLVKLPETDFFVESGPGWSPSTQSQLLIGKTQILSWKKFPQPGGLHKLIVLIAAFWQEFALRDENNLMHLG